MDVGALSLLITESGFAATMEKVAQVDAAAARVGAKPTEVKLSAPSAAPVQAALNRVQQTLSSIAGTTVPFTFNLAGTQQATAALGQVTQATQQTTAATQQETQATQQNTQAAQQNAQATQQQTQAQQRLGTTVATTGNATQALTPKVRSAANGIAALTFALTSAEPSFQSIALASGLVGSSLAESFGSAKMAAYASGIGAVLVVVGAFVGILERMTDRAAKARTAVDDVLASIRNIRSTTEAQAALTVAERDLARAERELADARKALTQGGPGPFSIFADIAKFRELSKVVEQLNQIVMAARHQLAVNEITQATELERARREIVVEGVAAEAKARDAAQQAQLARDEAQFATGRTSLQRFFDARLAFIRDSAQREIAVLRARQQALAAPDPDATPADAAKRAAEVARINTQIAEINARTQQQATEALEQRRQQRESLDRQILQFEQREAEASGDASEQRIQQARLEAREIARALVQRSGATTPKELEQAWNDANAAAQQYVDTQTTVIRAQQQQTAAQRIFNSLEIDRLTIQQQLARGTITQAEANAQLAAAEQARVDDLRKIAAEMERFGRALNNQDLINAARRLRAEIDGLGKAPLSSMAQRVKEVTDALSLAAAEGDRIAEDFLNKIEGLRRAGKPISLSVILEANWYLDIKRQIDEGLARLSFIIKPRNIKLEGVAGAIDQLNNEFSGLALNVGNAIDSSLAAGFSSAFTKGSGKNFAEAFGNALLSSIGNVMVNLGSSMLAYAAIMTVAEPLLALTPFAGAAIGAGQAAITGAALIALGAGMGAIAANNTGRRTGGGSAGSATSRPSREIPEQRTILDPDRAFRERQGVARTLAITPRTAIAPQRAVMNVYNLFGDPTPQSERFIARNNVGADGRNIPVVRRRR